MNLTHAIGRVPYGSQPDIFDFYRFTSAGTRLFTDNIPASSAYFSLDGGNTKLADFGVSSDPSDFLNAPGSSLTPNDAFDEFYSNNPLQSLTPVDLQMLDALGFNTMPLGLVVVANAAQALQGSAAVLAAQRRPGDQRSRQHHAVERERSRLRMPAATPSLATSFLSMASRTAHSTASSARAGMRPPIP